MNITIKTFGCKANRYESDKVFEELALKGYKISEFKNDNSLEKFDYLILNTCSVTHLADLSSIKFINLFKSNNPKSKIIVFGCAFNVSKGIFPETNIDFFCKDRNEILNYFNEQESCSPMHSIFNSESSSQKDELRTRALLKIQDGCENFCSYCVIPYARGKEISYSSSDIINQLVKLESLGYKEVVITGINIGKWKENSLGFSDLIRLMLKSTKDIRFRLSSLEARLFEKDFYDLFYDKRICPHLHLSLQSGSNTVLKRMNRKYTTEDFFQIVEKLKLINPDFAFTTDIIVGFPGESDEEFDESLEFIKKVSFSKIHTFPFSKRPKTMAYHFPNQIPKKVIKERIKKLMELSIKIRKNFLEKYIGEDLIVLVEGGKSLINRKGFTENYLPVSFAGKKDLRNQFLKIKVNSIDEKLLILKGEIV